jgi:hypothetical protein
MYPQPPNDPQSQNHPETSAVSAQIHELQRQLTAQAYRIADLEARLPRTNLVSPNFISRAFAVWGHYFVSNLILSLIFGCISLVIGFIIATVFGLTLADLQMNW